MADITGKVVDNNNILIPNVSVLLTGGGVAPQVTLTAIDGSFTFAGQAVGSYKVSAVRGRTVSEKVAEIVVGQTTDTVVDLKIFTIPPIPPRPIDIIIANRFVLLKYGQYIFLAFIGWFFFDRLVAERMPDLSLAKLNNIETARGAITYLVAVTTISMAAILMLAAIMTGGKDLDKRFTLGKEILTLLIGILGTIIGFYYGSSDKSGTEGGTTAQVDTLLLSRENQEIIVSGKITGGDRPYVYSITSIPPGLVSRVTDKQSQNGLINDTLTIVDATKLGPVLTLALKGKDRTNTTFSREEELKLKK